jgi:hypothetical protein
MPVSNQYNAAHNRQKPHIIDVAGKGQDVIERMIDKISGEMVLFDMSESSLPLDYIDLYGDDNDNDDDDESDSVTTRRVSFSEQLVKDVWERPRTTPEEKLLLFYSGKQIWEFRMEYRAIVRRRRTPAKGIPATTPTKAISSSSSSSSSSSGLSGLLKKATQVATFISQSGHSLSLFAETVDNSDAMLVVDTLYLF